jgi:3-oxoacyl-[acyl-carrier-protein] synthase II
MERTLAGIDVSGNSTYVMSHGTGTPHNDVVEARAIKQVGSFDSSVVSAAKSVVGHMLGASGAYETVILVKAIREGIAPAVANFTEARQGCDLDYVVGAPRKLDGPVGLKCAFAFGGNNVAVAIGPAERSVARGNETRGAIVITGMGVVSPVNLFGLDEIKKWQLSGNSPISSIQPVRGFNRSATAKLAAVVDPKRLLELCRDLRIKNVRKMDRISRLATAAAALALKDSGFKITNANALGVGLVSASGYGSVESVSAFYQNLIANGAKCADPNVFPNTVVNAHLGYVSMELKIKGYTTVLAQGSSSPYAALATAQSLLDSGMCECVLVGAVSEYSEAFHRILIDLGIVSAWADVRSYGWGSRSNVCAEGAVFFFLERETPAHNRGAKLYARVRDVAINGVPAFPAMYRMERNPLTPILSRFRDEYGIPTYFAGDGNRLPQVSALEYQALSAAYPCLPLTSATPYFGMASGVVPFYNMATFCMHVGDDRIPGVPHAEPSAYPALVRGIRDSGRVQDCAIGTVAPGGSAGDVYLQRLES